MCSPQAVQALSIGATGAGNMLDSRAQHRTQMDQMQAQQQAMQKTSDRERLLRAMERSRQQDMNRQQMGAFGQALESANPENIDAMQQDSQRDRMDLVNQIRAQGRPDTTLPGTRMPGGSGVTDQANRVVQGELDRGAADLGQRAGALNAFPDAMRGLGMAFQAPQFNIGRLGRDSQQSAALLPAEMDAAFTAPVFRAPRGNMLGQLLAGAGQVGSHVAGLQAGRQQAGQQQLAQLQQFMQQNRPMGAFTPFGGGG